MVNLYSDAVIIKATDVLDADHHDSAVLQFLEKVSSRLEDIQDDVHNMADDVDSDGDVDGGLQDWLPPDVSNGVLNL